MTLLRRLAASAPPPVFPCIGPRMLAPVERLFANGGARRALSPASAGVLLVAGDVPDRAAAAVDRLHDQVPPPRRTVGWNGADEPSNSLHDAWSGVLSVDEAEPDSLPDEPPNEWRGKGDHGHGGEGMMGGTPYGRPMAMTGEDPRDGLQLDRYTMRVGPFAPMLPPGLELEVTLQGDLIAAARVLQPPFPQEETASAPPACAARMLRLLGLPHHADRLLRGGRLRAGVLRAVPTGLGAAMSERDARARLRRWLDGEPGAVQAPEIGALITGLEWHEAMLLLNSWSPEALRRAAEAA